MPPLSLDVLEAMIRLLDAGDAGYANRVSELRRQMDRSCDQGAISLRQWRLLLDMLGPIQRQSDA
jgi:hypothetical protein